MTSTSPRSVEGAVRARIRELHAKSGRRVAVLDDDPTGSQAVHGVSVVTSLDRDDVLAGLSEPGSCCFVLTNTRGVSEPEAVALNREAAALFVEIGDELDVPIEIVSRSDSTLRGHVYAEIRALDDSRRERFGHGYHATLFAPAFLEAGRFTDGDVHYARLGDEEVPVGETEFARDASFGYSSSNLGDFLIEKSAGAIERSAVVSLGLDEIRRGGERVAEILTASPPGSYVIVNARTYGDLENVALGVALAERAGYAFLHRCAPSYVRALTGIEPRPPLGPEEINSGESRTGHGLIVVGSHVGLTNAQLATLLSRRVLAVVELDVEAITDARDGARSVEDAAAAVLLSLEREDTLVFTSRSLLRGEDADTSLAISRRISGALAHITAVALRARPAWVVTKGGITSHDIAIDGLGVRRATVLGQLLPGMISVFRPVTAAPEAVDMPLVVFAGNVGDESTLDYVVGVLGSAT